MSEIKPLIKKWASSDGENKVQEAVKNGLKQKIYLKI